MVQDIYFVENAYLDCIKKPYQYSLNSELFGVGGI